MAPIAITMKVSNASDQEEVGIFLFFDFLRYANSKFVKISIEFIIKVFLVLKFSVSSEL